jgi:predicted phosphodiesterase
MRTIVFGDIHGNLPALDAMIQHAGRADRYVCVGDVVNYGPWGDECVDRIAALPNCEPLRGNHEVAFLQGSYDGVHPVARAFFEFCYPRFSRRELLTGYIEATQVGSFRAQHTLGDGYIFADTPIRLDRDYMIGHSHHQFVRTSDGHLLVNVGSVGQNRKDLRVCHYAVHGPEPGQVRLAGCVYDYLALIDEMKRQKYPEICLNYYLGKIGHGPLSFPS